MIDAWRVWAGVDNPDGTPVCNDCTACDTIPCSECGEPQCVRLNREGPNQ